MAPVGGFAADAAFQRPWVYHPDDMCGIILGAYGHYLRKEGFDLRHEVKIYRACGKLTRLLREMQEAEIDAAAADGDNTTGQEEELDNAEPDEHQADSAPAIAC